MKVRDLKKILDNLDDGLDVEMPDGLPLIQVNLSPDGKTCYLSDMADEDVIVVWQEPQDIVN